MLKQEVNDTGAYFSLTLPAFQVDWIGPRNIVSVLRRIEAYLSKYFVS